MFPKRHLLGQFLLLTILGLLLLSLFDSNPWWKVVFCRGPAGHRRGSHSLPNRAHTPVPHHLRHPGGLCAAGEWGRNCPFPQAQTGKAV